jgi:hypothetical protein
LDGAIEMEKQQLTCRECGQTFSSSDELDRHNREAHGSTSSGHGGSNGSDYQSGLQSGVQGSTRGGAGSKGPMDDDRKSQPRGSMGSGGSGQSYGGEGSSQSSANKGSGGGGWNTPSQSGGRASNSGMSRSNPNSRDQDVSSRQYKDLSGKNPKKSMDEDERE